MSRPVQSSPKLHVNSRSWLPDLRPVAWLTLGLFSNLALLAQPGITVPPRSQTNRLGTTATFSITATGTQPLAYQWQFYSSLLAGQTNPMLVLTNVQVSNAGNYAVVVTNVDGSATSAVATLTVLVPPTVVARVGYPTYQSVSLGANMTFVFSGSSTLSVGISARRVANRVNFNLQSKRVFRTATRIGSRKRCMSVPPTPAQS